MKIIVFIITGLSTGGAEMMLFKLLSHLDKQKFSPHVISLTTLGEMGSRISALGISVEALGIKPALPSPFLFWRLVKRLKKLQPDVVHTWMYHADLLGGLAAWFSGNRRIAWCLRNSNLDKNKTKFTTRLVVGLCAKLSTWLPAKIISCSEEARRVHVALGYAAEKMQVIPNGFDLTRFCPNLPARASIRAELKLGSNILLVGLIARFDPQKNHQGFFHAAKLVNQAMPEVHFVLVGKEMDPQNKAVQEMILSAGIGKNTHLLGLREDISTIMASLDILSSSSYGEAFPNVLGEAMACGVPCAVTNVGDSAYIVGDTGKVVESGDMAGLAAAIQELLTLSPTEKSALNEKARARVVQLFEIGQVVKQYEDFYINL